jgi:hypothetical protein
MKQVRAMLTYHSKGVIGAMLQEVDFLDEYGHLHWKDIRPLECNINADGSVKVLLSQEETRSISHESSEG